MSVQELLHLQQLHFNNKTTEPDNMKIIFSKYYFSIFLVNTEIFFQPHQDTGIQSWGDESKWRSGTEDSNHTPFSERSRKDKGGFRSSFKKLFKKK